MGAGGRGTPTPRRSRDNGASWDLSRCDLQSMLSDSFCEGTPTDDEGHSSRLSCVCPQGCGRRLKTTDVADADRVGIVTATMGSGDVFWTGGLDGAFDGDDVVVAAACPTEGSVVTSGN